MHGARLVTAVQCATLMALAAVSVCGCTRHEPDETPEGAVREWIDRMQASGEREPEAKAIAMLSKQARANLDERAERASAAIGRKLLAEEMIVPWRFSLRFSPQQMKSRIGGDRAVVEAIGADPTERASVPCVREDGHWRVDLQLPPLPLIEKRSEPPKKTP